MTCFHRTSITFFSNSSRRCSSIGLDNGSQPLHPKCISELFSPMNLSPVQQLSLPGPFFLFGADCNIPETYHKSCSFGYAQIFALYFLKRFFLSQLKSLQTNYGPLSKSWVSSGCLSLANSQKSYLPELKQLKKAAFNVVIPTLFKCISNLDFFF